MKVRQARKIIYHMLNRDKWIVLENFLRPSGSFDQWKPRTKHTAFLTIMRYWDRIGSSRNS